LAGKVYLLGAGPGDPDLLTVKALRVLQSADVVLHDALIDPAILGLASVRAEILNVGKRCGSKAITQQEINRLIVDFAKSGKIVVRLKSGDPLIFGRAGEEIEALRDAGIPFEVIPGITAACGAAAATRIVLYDQRHPSKLVFVTAHHASDKPSPDWKSLASPDTTLVIYMPGENYAGLAKQLMSAGFAEDMPCIAISNATRTHQRSYHTTIAQLSEVPKMASPALLIVGEVARQSMAGSEQTVTSACTDVADSKPREDQGAHAQRVVAAPNR
jgi:uroporphyrin-III C-methyltransferase